MKLLNQGLMIIVIVTIMLSAVFKSISIMVGAVVIVAFGKLYIYKRYRDMGETDKFWEQTSKPLLVAVLTIFLLLILEHYNMFESLSKLL